jgi:mannobiose 2-epimerase
MQVMTEAQTYIRKADFELRDDILPFWMAHAVDPIRGGFHGELSNDLVPDQNADRGALLSGRILWAYAAAYRCYGLPAYRHMADTAYADLITRFWDESCGGLFWSVGADGRVLDAQKYLFNQAFGIYALAEYARATGSQPALDQALALFELIEAHGSDRKGQGYIEACTRDWRPLGQARLSETDLVAEKSLNTHLHIMEAYTGLAQVWDSPRLRGRLAATVELMIERIVDPHTGHARHFFDGAWRPLSDRVIFGHDIETSWLLTAAAEQVGDPALLAQAEQVALRMAEATYAEGRDIDGALFYEADAHGLTQDQKEWWPQAEAAVGFLNAYQISGQPHFLDAALRCWDFIEQHLIDRTHGEWFKQVSCDGRPSLDEPKISFWKCPYHNTRTCLELIERLQRLG